MFLSLNGSYGERFRAELCRSQRESIYRRVSGTRIWRGSWREIRRGGERRNERSFIYERDADGFLTK